MAHLLPPSDGTPAAAPASFARLRLPTDPRRRRGWALAAAATALLAGCATPLPPMPPAEPAPPLILPPPPQPAEPPAPAEIPPDPGSLSYAKTPREYRRDAAAHLYAANAERIYKGRLPPLLYAVGVLQVDLDPRGMVSGLRWMRAPTHAPEVIAEIERTVRAAAPYPVPVHLGHVTYTDVWLWHKSGRFQLDTLTEGQDGIAHGDAQTPSPAASRAASSSSSGPTAGRAAHSPSIRTPRASRAISVR